MVFNVKTRWAAGICAHVLALPAGQRNWSSGFWTASVASVQGAQTIRIACMRRRLFLLEGVIIRAEVHQMCVERMHEYLALERVKRSCDPTPVSDDELLVKLHDCIQRGRIVVPFCDARIMNLPLTNTGRSPFWFTDD